jgi:SsrA-binding protein
MSIHCPILALMKDADQIRYIARNRRARRDYDILSSLEAGLELRGAEVKSLREGKINLSDSYAVVEHNEVYLKNLHISPYKMDTDTSYDPLRPRRLLLHKREIRKMFVQTEQKGLTLIPLSLYFKGNLAKVELAVAAGRKKYDKRQAIAEAEANRKIRQALKKDL